MTWKKLLFTGVMQIRRTAKFIMPPPVRASRFYYCTRHQGPGMSIAMCYRLSEAGIEPFSELWQRRMPFYPNDRSDILTRFVLDALKVNDRMEEGHRAVNIYKMEDLVWIENLWA